ncbi:ATP-binding cassette domain-containing protein [Virgibacillus sp. 179-BFC.A HS]|uniref:ATP-binding cassette domain-containing protein n=1 Tax=Tigheibacillus jepli TaxID=3035914 RepID=A0ABU5CNE8_9BACI|nr:ATP-binding cassette domain-containing protein [Virgibacillus sp. 179-BFC.A HS]MDY0406973.1 ATP-binding cassette domain-containing protein [Virgibacillus sp. 179-BFC.A HS]
MIICNLQDVTQTHGATTVFENINWQIKSEERIGLIGRNGEGKTTLLYLLAGLTAPAKGTVSWSKNETKGMLEQLPNVNENEIVETILYQAFSSIPSFGSF